MKLTCNFWRHLLFKRDYEGKKVAYCRKLKHLIENEYQMRYHGGIIGNPRYPAKCEVALEDLHLEA